MQLKVYWKGIMIRLNRPECPNPQALENGDYKYRENKQALRQASHDKCMYCESKISHIDYAHVEHIKPKADNKFPELEFDWDNLGYSCPKCNNAKSDKYDVNTPFIDPYAENPEEHIFVFGCILFPRNGSERGDLTILEIELNRADLLEKRQTRIDEITKVLNACFRTNNDNLRNNAMESIRQEANVDKEYSLVVNALIKAHDRN